MNCAICWSCLVFCKSSEMNKKSAADVSFAGPNNASTSSATEDTSSSDSTFFAAAAKKGKRQAFREAWLQDPSFKSWLKRVDDPHKAKCTACSKLLRAHKNHLDEHAKSDSHIKNLQQNTGASISVRSNAATSSSGIENDSSAGVSIAGPNNASTSSATEDTSSTDSTFLAPAAKKGKRQTFREAWLQDPSFKSWLKQVDDPHKAKCTACSKLLRAHKNHLDKHAKSDSHIKNLQQNAGASISVRSNAATSSSGTENDSSAGVSIAGPRSAASAITSSGSAGSFTCPPAKEPKTAETLHRKQAFRKAWLKDPQFQFWLQETENPYKAKCTLCSKFIIAGKSHLQQHAITDFHITNVQQKTGVSISVPSNAATTSIDTNFARPGNAATTSIDTNFARPGNAAISSSDAENNSSNHSTFIVLAAQKLRRQTSCQAWLVDPHFKPWLQQANDPHKAKGTVFSKYVTIGQSDLQNHANSKAHIMNMVQQKEALTSTVKRTFADNVKVAEMTICIDAIEHGRSLQSYCHFIRMLQKALPGPNLLSRVSLERTKMIAIVKNVTNKSIITKRLQGKFFSVLIDETTDISDTKIIRGNARWMKYRLRIQQAKRQVLVSAEMEKHRLLHVAFILSSMIIGMLEFPGRCGKRSLCRKSKYKP